MSQIETVWGIEENVNQDRHEWPWLVVSTLPSGKRMGFGCRTLEEAHAKLQAIAIVEHESGKRMMVH